VAPATTKSTTNIQPIQTPASTSISTTTLKTTLSTSSTIASALTQRPTKKCFRGDGFCKNFVFHLLNNLGVHFLILFKILNI
jgi:hypothetical protein